MSNPIAVAVLSLSGIYVELMWIRWQLAEEALKFMDEHYHEFPVVATAPGTFSDKNISGLPRHTRKYHVFFCLVQGANRLYFRNVYLSNNFKTNIRIFTN